MARIVIPVAPQETHSQPPTDSTTPPITKNNNVHRPAMLHASHLSHHSPSGGRQGILRKSNEALSPSSTVIRFSTSEATTAQAMSSLSGGVELEQISGKRLWVQFAAFGFFKRECELELKENGDCIFSKGMVTKGAGAWRVEVRARVRTRV